MPKIPLTKHEKSSIYAQKYPSEFRVLPNGELICKLCDKPVNSKMPDLQKLIDPPDDCDPNIISLLQRSPASDAVIERSFSKLRKLLASDRNFADENLPDYVIGFVNSSE